MSSNDYSELLAFEQEKWWLYKAYVIFYSSSIPRPSKRANFKTYGWHFIYVRKKRRDV